MKAVISTFGTRGDFEPFIALAQELMDHGHEVTFAIPDFVLSELQQLEFKCAIIARGMPDLRNEVNLIWSTQKNAYISGVSALENLAKLKSSFPHIVEALSNVCSSASVLVSGPAQPLARVVHDLSGIPFVSVQVSHFGGNGGPALTEIGNNLINGFRRDAGLTPIRDPLTTGANSPQLALYAMSTHVIRRSDEWPKHHHLTGFFYRPGYPELEPQLEAFLNTGPPPVAVSFGSMPHMQAEVLKKTIVDAIRISKCRAVIQGLKTDNTNDESTTSNIYWAESVPHARLFPRCGCIVTHGGAGTTAAVLRAGIPGVFVPHGDVYDQRYWAQLAKELRCSVGAVPLQDLNVEVLASAIQESLTNPVIRAEARKLGERIERERGVQSARQLTEDLVRKLGLED